MASNWEPTAVKAQLRVTSQRLGQMQEKKDSKGNITRRDIATLLQQGNVGLARAKAQNLIQEDAAGDLLEVLEMHVGLILEHFNEIDQDASPSPIVVEAASSIIFGAPQTESKDLNVVRDLLIQRLGPDFARSAIGNRDNHVSSRVIRALSAPPPSAANLDAYLLNISQTYGVKWSPELRRQDILNPVSEILDPETSPIVDLPRLRRLCSHGIPDEPSWLRPRIWKLFFGILPVLKSSWAGEIGKQRESYYDLIRRLLSPFSGLPPPETPLATLDEALLSISKQLSRVPPSLFSGLSDEPEMSRLCPLDDIATDDIKITCAANLDSRLKAIQGRDSKASISPVTPEIRLESDNDGTPEISLSTFEPFTQSQNAPTTLLPSRAYTTGSAHQKHSSALLRLLYLHSCINPGNHSPHIPSLLVPLYSVLVQEIEPQDLVHVEADTFWLFEAMVSEFSELEDEEGGNLWMRRFSERLAWADADLSASLHAKGLDPALPHYSYRWLAPLLTQTLPLSSVFLIWDALFACRMRERDSNPKLDYLIDICTGMLIRARTALFRLGKPGGKSPSLWIEENDGLPPPSPLRAWELSDAFLEGMSLLQLYPVEAAGGIDRLLQTASDLAHRREEEAKTQQSNNLSLGARLKVTMWKGFTNQIPSPERSPVDWEEYQDEDVKLPDDGNETETPPNRGSSGITSRLATTVWKGITNQTSMEPPPSPLTPLSPSTSRPPSPSNSSSLSTKTDEVSSPEPSPSSQGSSSIWSYAEKLKDSDAAATLAKVSSNWKAKALLGSWGVRGNATSPLSAPASPSMSSMEVRARGESMSEGNYLKFDTRRRDSLPGTEASTYSPPARPTFFRPPRDSMLPQPRRGPMFSPLSPDLSPPSDGSPVNKTKNIQASLASLTRTRVQPTPKTGPRPLLLNSSSLITASQQDPRISRSATSTPTAERGQWSDVLRGKGHNLHRDSQSSISSLSPSDALSRPLNSGSRSDWDSDTGGSSRVVPLNRRSISPMALGSRFPSIDRRPTSGSSSANSSDRGLLSPTIASPYSPSYGVRQNSKSTGSQGWGRVDMPSSPPIASPTIPRTPVTIPSFADSTVYVADTEHQRGSVVLSDPHVSPLEPSHKKSLRKKSPPSTSHETDDTSDSSVMRAPPRSPRIRSKRYPARPANLRIQENSRSRTMDQKTTSPNSLGVEWPEDQDVVTTPRASSFDIDGPSSISPISPRSPRRSRKVSTDGEARLRKTSTDSHEIRPRKVSVDSRTRKVSTENKELSRRTRESAAEEGDDEGYDDLLSAYESEEGSTMSLR